MGSEKCLKENVVYFLHRMSSVGIKTLNGGLYGIEFRKYFAFIALNYLIQQYSFLRGISRPKFELLCNM